jgi:hypothetical protein
MPKCRVKRHAVTQPLDTSYRLIPLTQGQNAIVDADDYEWLNQWNWHAWLNSFTKSYYAVRKFSKERKTLYMANVILSCEFGEEGDHKNHDTLDNRRQNLRKCSHHQNTFNRRRPKSNTSGFKGVRRDYSSWQAYITISGKFIHLGCFDSTLDAARAYDEAAKKFHGEFAHLNFPNLADKKASSLMTAR